jgi:hypothetical protein
MKKIILIAFLFLLTACGTSSNVTSTPTPNPGEIALQMLQQQMAANATSQVVGLNFTATAQVVGATATANQLVVEGQWTEQARQDAAATSEQHRQDAQATSEQHRQDVQATQARMDADTQATRSADAVIQARIDAQSTSDSLATSTFTVMTLTAIPPHATLTQIAVNNQIAIATQEVERSSLSLQQARDTNKVSWQAPLMAAIVGLGMALLWVIRKSRWNVITNEDGEVEGFGFDEQYINPKLLPGPVLDLKAKTMPQLTDPATQKEIVNNEQKIRALAAMPIQPTSSGVTAYNQLFGQAEKKAMPVIEVIPSEQVGDQILEEIEGQVVEEG